MSGRAPAVVAIGGGHGLATTLRAARTYAGRLTAVVSVADDGGSSGRLRDGLGVAAVGDLRRCVTAMAADRRAAEALEHRYSAGELAGHPVGNLVLAGLVDAGSTLTEAAATMAAWLGVDAGVAVVPATSVAVDLVAVAAEGTVRGQVRIESTPGIVSVGTDPADPPVPDEALAAIEAADQVVLGPGSFLTSIVATAAVPALARAIAASAAPLVFVCNLRAGEPCVAGFDVARHVAVLMDHGVRPDVVVAQHDAIATGDLPAGVRLVAADIDRPSRLAHDADLLGVVLAALV